MRKLLAVAGLLVGVVGCNVGPEELVEVGQQEAEPVGEAQQEAFVAYELDAASAAAEFEQSGYTIDKAFDNVENTSGWAVNDGLSPDVTSQTREACAQLTTGTTPDYAAGATKVRFVLKHLSGNSLYYLGKFKLYVTRAPKTAFANGGSDCNLAEDGYAWAVVEPSSYTTNVSGLTLSETADNALVVNSCAATSGSVTFTITGTAGIDQITGIRIQAIDDDTVSYLPTGGPGCAGNGNFVLSEVHFSADATTEWCVTVSGSAEWCGPVPGVVRYTTSTPGTYTVRRNNTCGNYSGGEACQYELLRNGVKVTDSGVGRWYTTGISSYTAGPCPEAQQPIACGVRADGNITIP